MAVAYKKTNDESYTVSYARRGDKPGAGGEELYGTYKTKQEADKAVGEIQRWAARIKKGNAELGLTSSYWDIVRVEVEGGGTPSAVKSNAATQFGSIPETNRRSATMPSANSSTNRDGPVLSQATQRGMPVLPKASSVTNVTEPLGAAADATKLFLDFQRTSPLENVKTVDRVAKEILAQKYVSGAMNPSSQATTLRNWKAISEITKNQAALMEQGGKVLSGVGYATAGIEVIDKVVQAPEGEKVETAAKFGSAKAFGILVSGETTKVALAACLPLVETGPGYAACVVLSAALGSLTGSGAESFLYKDVLNGK